MLQFIVRTDNLTLGSYLRNTLLNVNSGYLYPPPRPNTMSQQSQFITPQQ